MCNDHAWAQQVWITLTLISECSGTENTFEECGITQRDFAGCKGCNGGNYKRHPKIMCLPGKYFAHNSLSKCLWITANCTDGEIRLVGGSSMTEGRLEVCVGGRWGTVQNNDSQLVELVCSTLVSQLKVGDNKHQLNSCLVCYRFKSSHYFWPWNSSDKKLWNNEQCPPLHGHCRPVWWWFLWAWCCMKDIPRCYRLNY